MANKLYDIKIKSAAVDPTATDDSSLYYSVGSYWVNTSTKKVFFLHDNTATAAVWERVDQAKVNSTTTDPVVGSDDTAGYEIGSFWINTTTSKLFVALSVATGAAVWERVDQAKNNSAAVAPTATDDSAAGYEFGSIWINTVGNKVYVCADATATAAVWKRLDANTDVDATERSANFTATANSIHLVNCSGGSVTVTPPASPVIGDTFTVVDSRASSETNAIIISTTASKLYGAADNFVINNNGGSATFLYFDATVGWVVSK